MDVYFTVRVGRVLQQHAVSKTPHFGYGGFSRFHFSLKTRSIQTSTFCSNMMLSTVQFIQTKSALTRSKSSRCIIRRFWQTSVPLKTWCNNTTRERTNNKCEDFHNVMCHAIHHAHPNPFIPIELLWKTERESMERFERYLTGEDLFRHLRKRFQDIRRS